MPKTPTWPTLPLPERPAGCRISDWLLRELRSAILENRLSAGARLPSSRSLALQLGISRGTVSTVYEELLVEGYVTARVGDGTRVLPTEKALRADKSSPSSNSLPASGPARLSARAGRWQRTPFPIENTEIKAFRGNIPSVTDFPIGVWNRLTSRRLRLASRHLLSECDPLGYFPLREAIAVHLRETRGLRCSGEQIMIVSGTQMALDLTSRMLVDLDDAVWVEDPGYPGASDLLTAYGARVIPIPVDNHGMKVEEATREAPEARLAVVSAAHQFPLGVALSLPRRAELLLWARKNQSWIFEDDYDSEFRFSGRPLMGMQGMPGGEQVLFCGSFSKMLYPGVRMGYLVLPIRLIESFRRARSLIDRFPASLEQAVLCDFIIEGHFERHLRRMRMKYLERYTTLVEVSRQVWGERLVIDANDTGLQTMAWLGGRRSASPFSTKAGNLGYEFIPISRFSHAISSCLGHPINSGLQVGFGAIASEDLRAAIHAIGRIL